MNEAAASVDWMSRAVTRFRQYWLLKILGIAAGMTLFFVIYFWLLKHPQFPVTRMPLTGLDRLIRFQPWSISLYASLWIYVTLVPMLLQPRRELPAYLSAVSLLSFAGFLIFFFWPTAVPRPYIDWARYPAVAFLKSADASGNACPSLHVAFSVLTCLWLHRWLRQTQAPAHATFINVIWCVAIIYSTLATKQHVALDAAAGAALGLAIAVPYLYFLPGLRWLRRGFESS